MEEDKELPPDEHRCCQTAGKGKTWRCKNFRMGLGGDDSVFKSRQCEKHYNSAKCSKKRPRKMVTEEDDQPLDVTGGFQPFTTTTSGTIMGNGTANVRTKRENVERTEGSGEPESSTKTREPLVEFQSMENYKSRCFELSLELEKKKVECTKLQGELAQTRKTAAREDTERTFGDSTQCCGKMFSDLERRFLRMAECAEYRISKLESLVMRSGKESSILRSVDLLDSVKIGSEAQGLQTDVIPSGEKQTSCGGKEYSHAYLKTKEEVPNMYENLDEGKGWGSSEERPSKDHLEMSKKPFANLVSDGDSGESLGESEDYDSSGDSNTSLGTLMDMPAVKYRRNEEKWKFEADMLSSFEEDPDLNIKARATTLAKFLMDGACKSDLKKSLKELEEFDSNGVEDCKRIARSYSKQLFSIYQNGKDPYFHPAITASHGAQTAK